MSNLDRKQSENEFSIQKKPHSTTFNLPSLDELENVTLTLLNKYQEAISTIRDAKKVFSQLPVDEQLAIFFINNEKQEQANVSVVFNLQNMWWYEFYDYAKHRAKKMLTENTPWENESYRKHLERARRALKIADIDIVIELYKNFFPRYDMF